MQSESTQVPLWRQIQKNNFRSWKLLSQFLELDEASSAHFASSPVFPLNLPLRLAEKIQKNQLNDPILLQFLPNRLETQPVPGFSKDPVEDAAFRRKGRLLHKYKGRALLVASSACAMHCRYCFRQNFNYLDKSEDFSEELEILQADRSISEIILSGGDPLSLSDQNLSHLIKRLEKIGHLKRLRFHTRFPIGIPERIEESFLKILSETSLKVWFVIHCNHPTELDTEVLTALENIQRLGVPILNQAVLLKGVNDNFETLLTLYEKLGNQGINAYYLHQLDKVQGAAHFEVSEEMGTSLVEALATRLPGYAVPKYVKEIAGQEHKTRIT